MEVVFDQTYSCTRKNNGSLINSFGEILKKHGLKKKGIINLYYEGDEIIVEISTGKSTKSAGVTWRGVRVKINIGSKDPKARVKLLTLLDLVETIKKEINDAFQKSGATSF
jgi:hypothetical protein